MNLKDHIRTIPDYPKPGILFRDVTTLFGHPAAFDQAIRDLCAPWFDQGVDAVAGIEARGFIPGGAMAQALGAGFIPIRKKGKLPAETRSKAYDLEYGTDELHIHVDAVTPGMKVLLVDDLIATGGTALAGLSLLKDGGAQVLASTFLIDLPDLGGGDRLRDAGCPVHALMEFPGH